jgi:hypothetical protein
MRKRTSKMLLVAMAITIVALMGASHIMAEDCDPPDSCTVGGWTITLAKIEELSSGSGYIWTYNFTKLSGAKDVSHVDFSFPVCCPDPLLAIYSPKLDSSDISWDSSDPSSGFGNYIKEIFVRKFNTGTQKSNFTLSFETNSQSTAPVTVGFKSGTGFFSDAIAGPGCAIGLPQMAVGVEQIITNEDGELIKIIENPYTQCIENVQKWNSETGSYEDLKNKVALKFALKASNNEAALEFLGVPGQACSRAIVKSEGDQTWYYISGTWVWY